MLEALFAAAAEAVFSHILDTLEPAERLRDWLKRNPVKLAYQHALARTYAAFARQYPEFTASLFNESFLTIEATPELAKFLTRHQHPDHSQLVHLWAKSIATQTEAGQQSVEVLSKREDFNAASAYFVELLTSELKHESALQPLFDSRALESLPAIEAKLDTLAATLENDLKQALAIANNYQQTVVNNYQQTISYRSGGVDLHAQEVTIGGDVVGRDKIVDNSIRVGDISGAQAVAIGHGAHASVTNNYFTGDFVTLEDLYIRPDAVFQRVHVEDFVGREWLTAKVDAFLNDEKRKSGVFLLVGEAGVGKTSFMAHLVTERRYLHLFAEQVPGDVNVARALQSLGAQLVARYQIDPYKEKGTLPAIATFPDFLDRLLRLAAARLSAGEKIVIVCDALDEAGTAPNGNVFGLPSVLPDGVYFILSQRPVTVKLSVKADLIKETIDAAGTDNLNDVEQYLTAVSRRPEVSHQLRAHSYTEADFIRILKERSGGVWMYLFYIVSEITAGSRAPLDLATLPSGLAGYYTDYWGDWCEGRNGRGEGPAKWDAVYAPLLATLAAAQLPISLTLLLAWSHVQATEYDVERLLRRNWRAFITERDIDHTPHFALYHASLRDFLTGQVDRQGLVLEAEQLIDELARRTRDAHVHIVEYYRQQCNGDWVKLVDDDYARTHLCPHLSASGDAETMYQLVAMTNAWAEARYAKEESYTGYLIDLNRTWQHAETEAHGSIGRQTRCALIESSIHSLASNIPAGLLRQLVEARVWNPVRALSHIPQIPDEDGRADSLGQLASLLPESLMAEALNAACAITDKGARVGALTSLAPYLPDALQAEALSAALAIADDGARAKFLTSLAPHLPEPLKAQALQDALSASRAITKLDTRAEALTDLAPHLPEPLKTQVVHDALSAARAIGRADFRASVLTSLALHLPEPLKAQALQEALSAARTIGMLDFGASALTRLAPHLPEPLMAQALSAGRAISDEDNRAYALIGLAPHLPEQLQAEALSAARAIADEGARAETMTSLALHLPEPLKVQALQEAMSAARAITDECARAQALTSLAPHLPEPLKTQAVQEALSAARVAIDTDYYGSNVTRLAPFLPDSLKVQTLDVAQAITSAGARAGVLISLAPHLSGPLKVHAVQGALNAVRVINDPDEDAYAIILTSLAEFLPDSLKMQAMRDALSAARAISTEDLCAYTLTYLAPHLPEQLQAEALSAARAVAEEDARAKVLTSLAPYLPEPLKAQALQDALSAARAITNLDTRAEALTDLAAYLPEPLKTQAVQDALSAACAITKEGARAKALASLAPHLPEPLMAKALSAVVAIVDEDARLEAWIGLVPHLSDSLKVDALRMARTIAMEDFRAYALLVLALHLPEPLKAQAVQDALISARAITNLDTRARAFTDLAAYLPEPLKVQAAQEALSAARIITNLNTRAEALTDLAAYLPEPLKTHAVQEALSAARAITNLDTRAGALTDLAAYLPEPLKTQAVQEALSAAFAIITKDGRAEALICLAPHLPEPLLAEALSAALAIITKDGHAGALICLAPYLPEPLLADALSEFFSVAQFAEIIQIITIWSKSNYAEFHVGLWTEKLHTLAQDTRRELLRNLRVLLPLIDHLGGQAAIEEFFYALRDVTTWWP